MVGSILAARAALTATFTHVEPPVSRIQLAVANTDSAMCAWIPQAERLTAFMA